MARKHEVVDRDPIHDQMEADALPMLDARDERVAKLQENRVPTGDEAEAISVQAGGFAGGSTVITTPRDNGDAKFVPARHTTPAKPAAKAKE
jgi:hypothetical protein